MQDTVEMAVILCTEYKRTPNTESLLVFAIVVPCLRSTQPPSEVQSPNRTLVQQT